MIEVKEKKQNEFAVAVEERGARTEHIVTLDNTYWQRLTDGKTTKEELIKKSFQFLLEREPKESILSRFNLTMIKAYFPEFEEEIKR